MNLILRVAARFIESLQPQTDTFDTQMAISQILLRNGWETGIGGRIIKKVRAQGLMAPKVYVLEMLRDGHLATRDRDGRVLARVRLKPSMSPSDLMNAAKLLNSAAAKLVMASAIRPDDMKDAWGVFLEWLGTQSTYKVHDPQSLKSMFSTSQKIESLKLSDLQIFQDWGRRPSAKNRENPIVTLALPDGRYLVLDGQHRVLAKREQGSSTISGVAIKLPWNRGAKRNGRPTYYI